MSSDDDFKNIEQLKLEKKWPDASFSAFAMIPYLRRIPGEIIGVEVGVLRADNICFLLESLPNIRKIYGIDNFSAHTDFDTVRTDEDMKKFEKIAKENLLSFGNRCVLIRKPSISATKSIKEEVDFILIDGEHTYDGVKADLNSYYPILKKGGYIFIHDTFASTIAAAVHDFRNENKIRIPLLKSKNYVDFWQK